jgi:hypothetical protein
MISSMKSQKSGSIWLPPLFGNIPTELKNQNRWLVWRGEKIPRDAKALNSFASSTDPKTWASFEQACTAYEEGGYEGVAFALAGDGIVGIDLDDCVVEGKPSEASMALMQTIGCEYIELSPSGTGLRGFGYVENPPHKGLGRTLKGLQVELYSTARYLTVTGHIVKAGPLVKLRGYCELHKQLGQIEFTEETEVIEETEAIDFNSSVDKGAVIKAEAFPLKTLPTGAGQRHRCIFLLARHLKIKFPTADVESMRVVLLEWHRQVLPFIRTKDFMESWLEFKYAWLNVKYSSGIMDTIIAGLGSLQDSNPGSVLGSSGEKLYWLCSELQAHEGKEPFFLSCHQAGRALQISHTYANNLLKEFCVLGLLVLTFKGVQGRASRYLLNKSPSA